MAKKVLVVDDERNIVNIIAYNLKKAGYEVITAYDGKSGYEKTLSEKPDLILLDVMMPIMDGYEVCREIRKTLNTPIIMLTARAEEADKVLGLEIGADDYVTKPFGVRELMARVKANLRRTDAGGEMKTGGLMEFGDLVIDQDKYEVRINGEPAELTFREYELLKYLAANKGQVFSREQLMETVWGYEYFGDVRTVDVTVRRLREKIEESPSKPRFVLTKRGVGYYFEG